jgi:hypothetical protein
MYGEAETMQRGNETLFFFTCKTLKGVLRAGGSADWVLDRRRAARCEYAVLTRNAKERPKPDEGVSHPEAHGSAWLIGKIADIVPTPEEEATSAGRYDVRFSAVAQIAVPGAWPGLRNPVAYFNAARAEELLGGLNLGDLDFRPLVAARSMIPARLSEAVDRALVRGVSVEELTALVTSYTEARQATSR